MKNASQPSRSPAARQARRIIRAYLATANALQLDDNSPEETAYLEQRLAALDAKLDAAQAHLAGIKRTPKTPKAEAKKPEPTKQAKAQPAPKAKKSAKPSFAPAELAKNVPTPTDIVAAVVADAKAKVARRPKAQVAQAVAA